MPLTSRIPEIEGSMAHIAGLIVEKTARDVERGAKVRSRVDTGQMKSGWRSHGTGAHWTVENSVRHTVFNEFGTRHMTSQPMLIPAVEAARSNFHKAIRSVFG